MFKKIKRTSGNSRTKVVLICLGLAVMLVSVVVLARMEQTATLLRIPNLNSIRNTPIVLILNPFRDKGPEIVSEIFLENLRAGKCSDVTAGFPVERSHYICEMQEKYPIRQWHLVDRAYENGQVKLTYQHTSGDASTEEELGIWTDRSNPNSWKVVAFSIVY